MSILSTVHGERRAPPQWWQQRERELCLKLSPCPAGCLLFPARTGLGPEMSAGQQVTSSCPGGVVCRSRMGSKGSAMGCVAQAGKAANEKGARVPKVASSGKPGETQNP